MGRTQIHFDNMPPIDYRKIDPKTDNLIETPLDHRGLVDLDGLIKIVKDTVEPEYSWLSSSNDVHHLQWYMALYRDHPDQTLALNFRELVNRKTYIPRVFHNWLHRVTLPPPVPTDEVMRYSVEAQRVAISLAQTASEAVRLTRRKEIKEKILRIRLEQAFEHFNLYLDNAREVPIEFSLLAIKELEIKTIDELLDVNKSLGRMAIGKIPIKDKLVKFN